MTFRSDQLVKEVMVVIDTQPPGWKDKVLELCAYHIEMRNHALRLDTTVHRLTKGMK